MRIRAGSQAKTGMAEEKETKGIDYQTWEFTGREYLEIAGISLGIAAAVNLLCYRAWWACIAVVPVGIVCFHTYRKNRIQRRKEELYDSFRDLIAWMHTALRSGYSMENAVLEAAGQLEQSLGKENILVQELRRMRHKMMISVPVEQLFQDLAVRSRIDDIATFASVLVIAKRTGARYNFSRKRRQQNAISVIQRCIFRTIRSSGKCHTEQRIKIYLCRMPFPVCLIVPANLL